jgi:hypothetical protein
LQTIINSQLYQYISGFVFASSSLPSIFYIIIITSTITMAIAYKHPTPLRRIFYFFRALFCYPPRHSLVSAPSAQSSRFHARISIRPSCFYSQLSQGLPLLFVLAIAILIPSPSTGVFFSEFAPISLGHASGQLRFSVADCSLRRFYSWFHGRALIPANCRPNWHNMHHHRTMDHHPRGLAVYLLYFLLHFRQVTVLDMLRCCA